GGGRGRSAARGPPGGGRMRRRRHRLQVTTFPFLAVLLCAMGSLILLLLVLDRRAKVVALHKAREAISRARAERPARDREALRAAEEARQAEERQAEERRAEWERRRQELRALLAAQEQEVQGEAEQVRVWEAAADADAAAEQARAGQLREQLQAVQG